MIVPFFAIFVFTFLLLLLVRMNKYKKLPPGPVRIPVLGSIIALYRADPKHPHMALAKLAEIYGNVMTIGFGASTAVAVSSYETIQEVFKSPEVNLDRYAFPFARDRSYGKNLGIAFSYGQQWLGAKAYTKKVLKEFGYGKVKVMDKSLAESANQLIDCIKSELLDSIDGAFVVNNGKFAVHVLNIVWNIAAGYKFSPTDELLRKNLKCVDKTIEIFGIQNPYNLFPFLKTWFPNLVNFPEHLKIYEEIHAFTKFLVDDAKEKRSQRFNQEPHSFIEVFLDRIGDCHGDTNPFFKTFFTIEQLNVILEDLMLASLESTGALLSWSILFMVLHTDIQDKVRQAIHNQTTDTFLASELKRIPYLKATILEIFRKGNVLPVPPPRSASTDLLIQNYTIPKGTILLYNLHTIFADKSYWIDPEIFRPERFLNESGEIDPQRSNRILNSVFGVGSRLCFADIVGLDSLFTFFAVLMINFKFDAIPGQEPSADNPHSGITVYPEQYSVRVTKLKD